MATKGITRLAKKIGIDNLTIFLIEDFEDIHKCELKNNPIIIWSLLIPHKYDKTYLW